ncbi:hypothetical protein RSOLAG22IIIB_11117 [Rhizoctonia solani]|uniref:Protein kinase domain-containing protein n=1 Tax=Rhizoctonia solani TaxID=456999 RepID=A0A0K6G6P2_9AGAM|nr:hypothetical protein RSOLAG22IIIB_11117 [Rhizoctonia solani]
MSKGSLPRYIKDTPEADRHSLCTQICEGLSYLHQIGITHGDLKGDNVLVSDEGIPALTDFGNSILTNASMKFTRSNGESNGTAMTLRWSAAEIIQGSSQTEASDVYSLGMTILEIMTEKIPYHGKADATVMFLVVLQKEPPARPENMPLGRNDTDKLWKLLLRCWAYDPVLRPTAVEVTDVMKLIDPPSTISSGMSTNHILQTLIDHGCVDLTHLLHNGTYSRVGGIDDVFMSNLTDGRTVLEKREKIYLNKNSVGGKALKRLAHELYIWSKCDHPNILHAIGMAGCDGQLAVVFPWASSMEVLPGYLSKNRRADRYLLVGNDSTTTYVHSLN